MTCLNVRPRLQRISAPTPPSAPKSPGARLAGQLQGLSSYTHFLFLKTHLVGCQHGRDISDAARSLCRRYAHDMNAAAREFASHARQLSPDALSPSTFGSQLARTVRQRTPAAWLSHLASEHHVLVNMLQYALHEATQQKYDPAIALTRDRLTVHHQAAREFGLCADGDQLPDA